MTMSHSLRIAILLILLLYTAFASWLSGKQSIALFIGGIITYLIILFALWLEGRNLRWHLKNYKRKIFQMLRNINHFQEPKLSHNASKMEIEVAEFYGTIGRQFKKSFDQEKQFTQNASHELQTPITVIRSAVDTILQSPNLTEEDFRNLDIILRNTNRLSKINNALVLISRIRSYYNDNVEKISINRVIKSVLEYNLESIELKNLKLIKHEQAELYFEMNGTLAEILVSNLISNAIKHNIKDGFIKIEILPMAFRISNSGKELKKDPQLLFERFSRDSDNADSLGLGLSIVKSICDYSKLNVDYNYRNCVHSLVVRK